MPTAITDIRVRTIADIALSSAAAGGTLPAPPVQVVPVAQAGRLLSLRAPGPGDWRTLPLAGLALGSDEARRVAMAETTSFAIGSDASCTEGVCGEVSRVVVDPVARAVTHLVV